MCGIRTTLPTTVTNTGGVKTSNPVVTNNNNSNVGNNNQIMVLLTLQLIPMIKIIHKLLVVKRWLDKQVFQQKHQQLMI